MLSFSSFEAQISQKVPNNINQDEDAEKKVRHWPWQILVVSAIQLFIFNYDLVETNEYKSDMPFDYVGLSFTYNRTMARLLILDANKRLEFWRYLTYIFVHFGTYHLIFNIILQIILSMLLQTKHGSWRIFSLYIISVMGAAGFVLYLMSTIYLAGASGGVYGLIGAQTATILSNWKQMEPITSVFQLVVFGALGLYNIYNWMRNNNVVTSYQCHAAGTVIGFTIGLALNKKLKINLLRLRFWKYAIVIILSLVIIYVCYYFFNLPKPNMLVAQTPTTSLSSTSNDSYY